MKLEVRKMIAGRLLFSFALVAFCCLLIGCPNSKTKVTKVSGSTPRSRSKLNGIFYTLPRTVLKVTVPVKKTTSSPGRYSKYAKIFFPKEDAVLKNSTSYKPEKPVFDSFAEPDPKEVYYVGLKSKFFQSKTLFLEYTEDGIFTQGKSKVEDQTPAIVGAVVKTAASIIGIPLSRKGVMGLDATTKRLSGTTNNSNNDDCDDVQDEDEKFRCKLLNPPEQRFYSKLRNSDERELYSRLSREHKKEWECHLRFINATITADQIGDCVKNPATPFKSQAEVFEILYGDGQPDSSKREFYRALMSYFEAQELFDRRELYINSSGNGLPVETFNAVLKEIDSQIKAYLGEYFLGTKEVETDELGPFEMPPSKAKLTAELFRFSRSTGKVKIGFEFAKPGLINPVKGGKFGGDPGGSADLSIVTLEFKRNSRPSEKQLAAIVDNQKYTENGDRGFRYRIPADYMVFVQADETTLEGGVVKSNPKDLGHNSFSFAQLGTTVSLPASTGSWTTSYELALYPKTGALKNFTLGSDALVQKSMIEDAQKAITTITDANDELKRLERQQKILDLQKKIRELQEEVEGGE